MKIWAWIAALGRPLETRLTIVSLGRSDDADKIKLHIHYNLPLSKAVNVNPKALEWMANWKQSPLGLFTMAQQELDIDAYLHEGGWTDAEKIIDEWYGGTPPSFRMAVEQFRQSPPDYEWFAWIENDCLINDNWFQRCYNAWESASRKFKVGIIFPCRTTLPGNAYGDELTSFSGDFMIRQVGASTFWLIRREVILNEKIDLSNFQPYKFITWDNDICNMLASACYKHIVLKDSAVFHAGKNGAILNPLNWLGQGAGGLGYYRSENIEDLFAEIK
jgi:hypothetical protein